MRIHIHKPASFRHLPEGPRVQTPLLPTLAWFKALSAPLLGLLAKMKHKALSTVKFS